MNYLELRKVSKYSYVGDYRYEVYDEDGNKLDLVIISSDKPEQLAADLAYHFTKYEHYKTVIVEIKDLTKEDK